LVRIDEAGTLDGQGGVIEMFPLVLSVLGSAKKNAHNLVTEILTILFPPPKHPSIEEFSESMGGLIR
jgi:hypothetical protein